MPNHLIRETSPYLRQHADNPVDWYPWGEEALSLARAQNKPILLSIGYSACHWCHVMAQESFEDADTARTMNTHFVNVKVDREERPDLDQIYQTAHFMLSRHGGGWPLTIFLTPDQTPFYSGTYFPATARYGLPGFRELIPRVADFYHQNASELHRQKASLQDALAATLPDPGATSAMDAGVLAGAVDELKRTFDRSWGGFGAAPKFPHPADLEFCLRRYRAGKDGDTRDMALHTLRKMAGGGIYDQLGGGFFRYSVDRSWTIPHFEKMLYDNGPLLALYADAWVLCGEARFAEVAAATAGWTMREMQSAEGGYYASLDADSEHEEGKFYLWTPEEIRARLSPEEFRVAGGYYGLDQPANFEERYWHLRAAHGPDEVAGRYGLSAEETGKLLARARDKLFSAREARVRPARDEKILASWNALAIKGMARAARAFGRGDWLASARRALAFVHREMWHEGRLDAVFKDGPRPLKGYLDDYAFMLDAVLEVMQADFQSADLAFAKLLAEALLAHFEDREAGAFFFTADDHETLLHRPKPGQDNALPAGNGVAAYALQRLGHMLGEARYLTAAERTLRLFYPLVEQQPGAFKTMLWALSEFLAPPRVVVMRGPQAELGRWQAELARSYLPDTLAFAIAGSERGLPGVLDKPPAARANAWLCAGNACLPPISDVASLQRFCEAGAPA